MFVVHHQGVVMRGRRTNRKPHQRDPAAIIFEVGSEGGSLAVEEREAEYGQCFIVSVDETTLNDLLGPDDEPFVPYEIGRALTFEDAIVMMDVYGWHYLFPCVVARHIRDIVGRALAVRMSGASVHDRLHLDAWRHCLGVRVSEPASTSEQAEERRKSCREDRRT